MEAGGGRRLFVWSADVFCEPATDEPWSRGTAWSEAARPALGWMLSHLGRNDQHLFCDGRSREVRRQLEQITGRTECIRMSEIWVTFTPTQRLGRRASDDKEVMLLSSWIPGPGQETDASRAAGEANRTSIYTCVEPVPWGALPQVRLEDKAKILGFAPAAPQGNIYDASRGVPLYWAERKPVALWRQLVADLDPQCIVDLSPGSGSLAHAALLAGVQYVGIVRTAEHGAWLDNVLDRCALGVTGRVGSCLYNQDMARRIQERFQDVLEQQREADAMRDPGLGPSSPDNE